MVVKFVNIKETRPLQVIGGRSKTLIYSILTIDVSRMSPYLDHQKGRDPTTGGGVVLRSLVVSGPGLTFRKPEGWRPSSVEITSHRSPLPSQTVVGRDRS